MGEVDTTNEDDMAAISISDEAYASADVVIQAFKEREDLDYSAHREHIADVFDNGLCGNWDCSTDLPDGSGLENLRFIEENEYDQSMDEDEDRPDDDDCVMFIEGHYIFYTY